MTASTFIGEPQRLQRRSIHLVDLGQQSCPSGAGLPGGDGLVRGILGNLADVESAVLRVLLLPSLGGLAHQVGSRLGQMLEELDQELEGGEQLRVCLEVWIVLRAVQGESYQVAVDVPDLGGGDAAARAPKDNGVIVNFDLLPFEPLDHVTNPAGLRPGVQEMTRVGMKESEAVVRPRFFSLDVPRARSWYTAPSSFRCLGGQEG